MTEEKGGDNVDKPVTTQDLVRAIAEGDNMEAVTVAQDLLDQGMELETVVEEGLTRALESLDYKCGNDQFSLLEILLAGRAMMDVMEQVVSQHFDFSNLQKDKRVFVMGTIQGDIHDLGKNIVSLMLKVGGFLVIDLGKDVPPQDFVTAAAREQAQYIGISSLITTTVPYVKEVKRLAEAQGLQVKVVAGGAALRQAEPQHLNVDFVAKNVFHLLRYLKEEGETR